MEFHVVVVFLLVNFLCSVFKKKKKVFNIIKLLVQTIA